MKSLIFFLVAGLWFLVNCDAFTQAPKVTTMDRRITFITLGVSDLAASKDFYTNIFGWKPSEMSTEDIVFYELNGIHLSLYKRELLAEDAQADPDGSGFKGFTLAYNTRTEKEVDDLINHFRSKNVKIIKEPQKVFWGGYSSYIADPDGNFWEIAYNPYLELNSAD